MCGIVGYVGKKDALPIVVNGLKQLEYRGYDSAGVVLWDGNQLRMKKSAGRVAMLEQELLQKSWHGSVAIAHTRWATHGKPLERNAHPHTDCSNDICVVHNGIIENFAVLKEVLEREGHIFKSETDSEVLAHLIERAFLMGGDVVSLKDAVSEGLRHVSGTFGMAVISSRDPNIIVAARRGSPLIVGIGEDEYLVASDVSAIVGSTKKIIYLHDNEMVVMSPTGYSICNLHKKPIQKEIEMIDWNIEAAQKEGFEHFMQKEIFEGPQALENAIRGRINAKTGEVKLGGLEVVADKLLDIERVVIVACGTSYYSGLIGKYYFEEFIKIPVSVEYASEFRYSNPVVGSKTAVICISQSGETADTLEALREAKKCSALTLGIVNVVGSTIARESDAGVYNHAGPEIGVASTKAFISQFGVLISIALFWKNLRENPDSAISNILKELKALPSKMNFVLDEDKEINNLAQKYLTYKNFLYIGRKYQFPVALEGALKLKEISYKHAEGYASGEMKHGPIALIDSSMPVMALCPKDSMYEKMMSNIQEIKSRDGKVIAVATKGDSAIKNIVDDVIYVPRTPEALLPFLTIIPLQLFAYHTAALLGLDVDKPRNLAKSVTVE
ncbi:MAG: glutamine--fructose-6-phosphate transaminase (isomerizing) [Patescibacteria group bacterium]